MFFVYIEIIFYLLKKYKNCITLIIILIINIHYFISSIINYYKLKTNFREIVIAYKTLCKQLKKVEIY